jgi:hypothetical protein
MTQAKSEWGPTNYPCVSAQRSGGCERGAALCPVAEALALGGSISADPAACAAPTRQVPGHELVGVVTAVGADVKGFAIGEKVGVGWCACALLQLCASERPC